VARFGRPLAIFFLSASTLAYEILLVRVFAIEQFYHFAYMAIGVAMLGFGATGTLLALVRPGRDRAAGWFVWAALLTPLALIASPALVHQIPLDPTQLPWEMGQWPRLAGVYLLLALPFALGALAILLGLTLEPGRVGWMYGASFLGAGAGALTAVGILWVAFPDRALAVPALVASLGAIASTLGGTRRARNLGLAAVTVAVAAGALARPLWRIEITPYKGLPQVEAYPEARRVAERTSPLGWVVAVEARAFRYAPGLSLAYRGPFPRQTALFVDGEIAGAVSDWGADTAALAILDWLPSAAAYALGGRRHVLIIGAGGGTEVWNALAHGARSVTAVELIPDLVRLAAGASGRSSGQRTEGRVAWVIGDARGFVSRTRERFDLVALSPGRAFGTSAAGVYALGEDFLHTVEAYVGYLARLDDDGVLAITRWLSVPPRESVRAVLTAAEALRRVAPGAVRSGMVVVRSWASVTVLVKPSGFRARDLQALAEWSRGRRFDLDWYPGLEAAPAPEFNLLDEPTLYRAAAAAAASADSAARFASAYAFAVAPADDARPYPHHFIRLGSIGEFLSRGRGSWLAFAEWGYIALLATLAQSVVLAAALMIAPAAIRARRGSARGRLRLLGYFSAIGLGYMAAEIAAIQQLQLLLGHPVYAVAAVLAALLVFSGAGSVWSDRWGKPAGRRAVWVLAVVLVLYAVTLLGLVHAVQPAQLAVRVVVALVVLAPVAFLMGLPFPHGLRYLAGADPEGVAWAWAANGFMSVVAVPAAALVALEAGSGTLFLLAAAAYSGAALLYRSEAGWMAARESS
jgi:hypothetical protein